MTFILAIQYYQKPIYVYNNRIKIMQTLQAANADQKSKLGMWN